VGRVELLTLYASRFSRELYGRKPVATFMRRDPVIVHQNTPVESLSQKITNCNLRWADDDFIVVDEGGNYIGVGMIVDLLRSITEMQIRNARYANPLTQLPGNVPVSEHIDTLLAQGHHFVLAYVDIDNFKLYNDEFGHSAGDDLLITISEILKDCSRDQDLVVRYGGEEFLLVLPSTGLDAAVILFERIRSAVKLKTPVTFSAGIATHTEDLTFDQLVEKAEQCLYLAKAEGRDRYVLAD